MRIASVGHLVFALTMIALGVMGFAGGGVGPLWEPVPKALPREALGYLCDIVALACGVGLLFRRTALAASGLLFVWLLVWMLAFKARFILQAPLVEGPYQSTGENAVEVAGAWVLFAWFGAERFKTFVTGDAGVRLARILYALAMFAFGFSHFVYVNLTTPLVPAYLGAPTAWAYFTGGAYLAAGVAMLLGLFGRLAATLSALQMGLFTLLIWVPMVVAGNISKGHWQETVVSWTLTAAAWVVADSYRGDPWFKARGGA